MSKLYITCYRNVATDSYNRAVLAPMAPPLAEMTVDITAKSKSSDVFPEYTTFICVKPETDCALAFGSDPVANSEYHLVEAGERLYYGVEAGQQVAVIEVVR